MVRSTACRVDLLIYDVIYTVVANMFSVPLGILFGADVSQRIQCNDRYAYAFN